MILYGCWWIYYVIHPNHLRFTVHSSLKLYIYSLIGVHEFIISNSNRVIAFSKSMKLVSINWNVTCTGWVKHPLWWICRVWSHAKSCWYCTHRSFQPHFLIARHVLLPATLQSMPHLSVVKAYAVMPFVIPWTLLLSTDWHNVDCLATVARLSSVSHLVVYIAFLVPTSELLRCVSITINF